MSGYPTHLYRHIRHQSINQSRIHSINHAIKKMRAPARRVPGYVELDHDADAPRACVLHHIRDI